MSEAKERKVLKSLLKPRKKGEASKNILRISVNKAEHLPAMDPTGLSDPFCKIKYEGKSQKTNVVRETLNPEWNESFDFEYKPESSLKIDVFDWDLVGTNDFMGRVVISMASVTHQYVQQWYELRDGKGNTVPFARINIGVQMMSEAEAGIAPAGKNVSLMSAVVANLKPILNNIFRLLYVLIRPILLQLIVLRKLFIDWESPTQTMLASVLFLYIWYYEYILSWLMLSVWWGLTKRLWTYRFFQAEYVGLDPDLKERDMLKLFKDTKIELKYGKDDPISEDVQKVAVVTGNISKAALKFQSFYNWQESFGPTLGAWIGIFVMAFVYPYIPWRFIFYWLFRIAFVVLWAVATIVVPLLRVFPTATVKIKRFFTARGFLAHIKKKYTTVEGADTFEELGRHEKEQLLSYGSVQMVRADRVLVERGEWSDLFFYPVTAVLRSGHTTYVKNFVRPVNLILGRFSALNHGFDMQSYVMRQLHPVSTMEGGKVIVFDVNLLLLEFQEHPNLAFNFYRWLAYSLTKRNDRNLTFKNAVSSSQKDSVEVLDDMDPDSRLEYPSESISDKDVLALRGAERRKQMVQSFREKFEVKADEVVLEVVGDVYRKHRGKKFYGSAFVTVNHLAFLPGTNAQQTERWIVSAEDVETAFVDKTGALEIRFVNNEVRHLYHDDRNVLMEVVSCINRMKAAHMEKEGSSSVIEDSPFLKRQNIRSSLVKSLNSGLKLGGSKLSSLRQSVLRGSARATVIEEKSPVATPTASVIEELDNSSDRGEKGVDEELAELGVVLGQSPSSGNETQLTMPKGTPEEWKHIKITDVMTPDMLKRILDRRMKRIYRAGKEILPQEERREVAVQVLWKGKAKAVRKTPGKPDMFLGFIHERSLFGETAYLLEAHAGASVVAMTDCVVYSLSGPWLDGVFDMDRQLGARFFEAMCLILLERMVLTEEILLNSGGANNGNNNNSNVLPNNVTPRLDAPTTSPSRQMDSMMESEIEFDDISE